MSSSVQWPAISSKTLFHYSHMILLDLTSFLLFCEIPAPVRRGCDTAVLLSTEHFTVFYSMSIDPCRSLYWFPSSTLLGGVGAMLIKWALRSVDIPVCSLSRPEKDKSRKEMTWLLFLEKRSEFWSPKNLWDKSTVWFWADIASSVGIEEARGYQTRKLTGKGDWFSKHSSYCVCAYFCPTFLSIIISLSPTGVYLCFSSTHWSIRTIY